MPAYDILNLFHDGTRIAQATTLAKESVDRADGNAVLDLRQTGSKGLGVVMIVPEAPGGAGQTLTVKIQGCATVDGTYIDLASFPVVTTGDTQKVYIVRFASDLRYFRAHMATSATTGNMDNVFVFILPWAFITV